MRDKVAILLHKRITSTRGLVIKIATVWKLITTNGDQPAFVVAVTGGRGCCSEGARQTTLITAITLAGPKQRPPALPAQWGCCPSLKIAPRSRPATARETEVLPTACYRGSCITPDTFPWRRAMDMTHAPTYLPPQGTLREGTGPMRDTGQLQKEHQEVGKKKKTNNNQEMVF